MIIFGWNKKTTKIIGGVTEKTCTYCNLHSVWKLALVRTWFTLFFIPIIPYGKKHCLLCENCGSYIELEKDQFEEIKSAIVTSENYVNSNQ